MRPALLVLLAGLLVLPATAGDGLPREIYVVNHGWHAGIAVAREDVPAGALPDLDVLDGAAYFEVGWGDAGYYPNPDPGLWALLRAALWPTPSVLHVAGLPRAPTAFFPGHQIVRLELSEEGGAALLAYIRSAFALDDEGGVQREGPGLYGDSRFYRGRDRYHLFNNCNHWVARALRAAGVPINPARALTATGLLRQVRAAGEIVQTRNS